MVDKVTDANKQFEDNKKKEETQGAAIDQWQSIYGEGDEYNNVNEFQQFLSESAQWEKENVVNPQKTTEERDDLPDNPQDTDITEANITNGPQVGEYESNTDERIINGETTEGYNTNDETYKDKNSSEDVLIFKVPNWSYANLLSERTSWIKGYDSATGEPGWFYFKIFFNFDTPNGLFGNIFNRDAQADVKDRIVDLETELYTDESGVSRSRVTGAKKRHTSSELYKYGDSAYRYLKINQNHYTKDHFGDRLVALEKFARSLSFINSHAPWFFESIGGLDQASVQSFKEPMKNNVLELGFKEEAVDMRISTLLDLYKYACFDYINLKEVVPQNLRQFDMVVVLFHAPLRYYHTATETMRRGAFPYKGFSSFEQGINGTSYIKSNWDDVMSYKMFSFKGCEFMHETLSTIYPSSMTNENPVMLGKNKIKISYKRVYQHNFNEWGRFMIGDDGLYWDDATGTSPRLLSIVDAKQNPYYYNAGADIFKPLVDATEAKVNYLMRQALPDVMLGNIYGDFTKVDGEYALQKLRDLKSPAKLGSYTENIRRSQRKKGIEKGLDKMKTNYQKYIAGGNILEKTKHHSAMSWYNKLFN